MQKLVAEATAKVTVPKLLKNSLTSTARSAKPGIGYNNWED